MRDVEILRFENDYRPIKSKMRIGNITIFLDKKFNWFNRLMIRLIFGFKIEGVNDNEKKER